MLTSVLLSQYKIQSMYTVWTHLIKSFFLLNAKVFRNSQPLYGAMAYATAACVAMRRIWNTKRCQRAHPVPFFRAKLHNLSYFQNWGPACEISETIRVGTHSMSLPTHATALKRKQRSQKCAKNDIHARGTSYCLKRKPSTGMLLRTHLSQTKLAQGFSPVNCTQNVQTENPQALVPYKRRRGREWLARTAKRSKCLP